MKKNLVIVLLLLISVFLIIYAKIKANDAKKVTMELVQTMEDAQLQAERAQLETERALQLAAKATKLEANSFELKMQLKECKGK